MVNIVSANVSGSVIRAPSVSVDILNLVGGNTTSNNKVVTAPILEGGWNLSTAIYGNETIDISGQDTQPNGIFFKSDGTKMYVVGNQQDRVYQYSLPTPWSLAGASYNGISLSVSSQSLSPQSLFFHPNGTKVYILSAHTVDAVYQYSLPTPWSLTGASYDNIFKSTGFEDNTPVGIYLKSDGTKMYIVGTNTKKIYQYSLPTPWSLTGASYDSINYTIPVGANNSVDIFFKPDGQTFYLAGLTSEEVHQYNLSSVWNLSDVADPALTYNPEESSILHGVFFKPNGRRMFILSNGGFPAVHQYDLTN